MKENNYPLSLKKTLRKLGADIKDARRRRRISVAVMSERASISRATLNKIEKGDPSVSFGSYSMVIFVLGLTERLSDLVDVKADELGLELAEQELPKRIRKSATGASNKKK